MTELARRSPETTVLRRPPGEAAPAYTDVDWQLSASTLARIEKAPAENTLTAYRRWLARWRTWCKQTGRVPLPATPHTLTEWVSHLCDEDTGMASLRTAVAAVRFFHATNGYEGEPAGKLAAMVRRSHARDRAAAGNRAKKATPILGSTPEAPGSLDAMMNTCAPDTLRGRRDRLVLVLGWAGMLRRSELAALTMDDVTPVADGLEVFIAWSKTDQEAKGATVPIPAELLGGIDPIQVWRDYVDMLAEHGHTTGQLLRSIDTGGRIGHKITGHAINELVRAAAIRANLPGATSYTAHSLRAGGATSAYRAGKPVSAIAAHGRWAPNSPVVLGYIRAVDKWKDNPMRGGGL